MGPAHILDFYAYLSGRYAVRKEVYSSSSGPVNLEVYYDPAHAYNIDGMLEASRGGLDYFRAHFSPYQFTQYRIMEFPRYRTFAQSFPNTVPFSEGIGFITRVLKPTDVTYFVTAHELGHQWWGHQLIDGEVQGSNMMSETLAQYSAYMVMQQKYGKDYMRRVLRHFLDLCLRGRAGEVRRERPLALVQHEDYVWYFKGGQIIYTLADYIGEDEVNLALHNFIMQYRYTNDANQADAVLSTGGAAAQDEPYASWIAVCAITALIPCSLVHAGKKIEEHRPADPQGEVETVNISGKVEVPGWDRNAVEVRGAAGDNVERVDVTSAGTHTSIHVVSHSVRSWGSDGKAHLIIHVPAKSMVSASLVSADFKVSGLSGDLKLQGVSGDVSGEVGGDVRASMVSGDIQIIGGGGDVDVTTVSGSATLELDEVSRGRLKSVSGDLSAQLAGAGDAQIDAESVSGDIKNCFGPKATESRYGPGSRLQFKSGEGRAHVQVQTKNGDVRLCTKGLASGNGMASIGAQLRPISRPVARVADMRMVVPYVY